MAGDISIPARALPEVGGTTSEGLTNCLPTEPRTPLNLLDTSFNVYRTHLQRIAALFATAFIPAYVLSYLLFDVYLIPFNKAGDAFASFDSVLYSVTLAILAGRPHEGVPGLVLVCGFAAGSGAIAWQIESIGRGESAPLREAYRQLARSAFRITPLFVLSIFGTCVALLFIAFAALTAVGVAGAALASFAAGLGSEVLLIGALLVAYVAVCGYIAWSNVTIAPIAAIEAGGLGRAYRRQTELVSKRRFRLALRAAMSVPPLVLGLIIAVRFGSEALVKQMQLSALMQEVLTQAILIAVAFLAYPIWMIYVTLLYRDLRMRREGRDLYADAAGIRPPEMSLLSQPPAHGAVMPGSLSGPR